MKIKTLSSHLLLIVIPFLFLELAFRALPVSNPPYILPVNSTSPVARLQPNVDYVYSQGWNFFIKTHNHSNNFGYANKYDYDPDANSPLLMVVGDSYVQADQVDAGKSAPELLNSEIGSVGRVYSIGLSGAPMSQYLAFAEYSKNAFHPQAMVFIIIANDFDESLLKYNSRQRFHLFQEDGTSLVLRRVDYKLSRFRSFLRKSAFIRYLMLNLQVKATIDKQLRRSSAQPSQYVGNVPFAVDEERLYDSKRATDEFFNELPGRTGLNASQILFLVDGMRPALYSPEALKEAEDSYFGKMRQYFQSRAISLGYQVIDMQPIFVDRNKVDNSKFEFEIDGHWNELGHQIAADTIRDSTVFKTTFSEIAH